MDLANPLASSMRMSDFVNSLDNSSYTKQEQSFISVKDEPLDLTDDSSEESPDANSQKIADKSTNKSAEVKENLSDDDKRAIIRVDNSCQNVDDDQDKSKIISDINSVSNVLVNSNFESVIDNFQVTCVKQNSQEPDDFSDESLEDSLLLEDNTFSCSLCSFTTDKQLRLNDHERNHRKTNLPIFQCFYCSQRYTKNLLYLHVQNVHPGQKFQIRDEKSYRATTDTLYKCAKCSFSAKYAGNLKLHMRKHPSRVIEKISTSSNSSKTEQDELIEPIEMSSKSETNLNCSFCSFSTSEQVLLATHVRTHLRPTKGTDSTGRPIWYCGVCSYNSANASHIDYHANSHINNKPIKKCPRCDFKSTSTPLFYHLKLCIKKTLSASNESPEIKSRVTRSGRSLVKSSKDKVSFKTSLKYKSYSVSRTDKLRFHKNKHLLVPEVLIDSFGHTIYQCKMCSYVQKKFVAMVGHIKSHKYLSVIKCSNCDFKSTPRAVKYHLHKCKESVKTDSAGNTNEVRIDPNSTPDYDAVSSKRQLNCSSCSFTTSNELNLKVHMRKHLYDPDVLTNSFGSKIYQCKMCSYESKKFVSIVRHTNSHKKNVPIIKCSNCDFKSTVRAVIFHRRKCEGSLKLVSTDNSDGNIDRNSIESSESNEISSETPLKCTTCSFSTSDDMILKKHMKAHFFEPEVIINSAGKKIYQCRMCSYFQRNFPGIVSHINSHKDVFYIVKCPNCDFKSMPRTVKFHLRRCTGSFKSPCVENTSDVEIEVDQNVGESSEPRGVSSKEHLKCSSCLFSTTEELKLKLHMKTHVEVPGVLTDQSGHKLYRCKKCSYVCKKSSRMVGHINSHKNNLSIVKCPYCDFKSMPRTVKFHLRRCTGSLKSPCVKNTSDVEIEVDQNVAESSETRGVSSKEHLKCSSCLFSTTEELKLKLHMKTHVGVPGVLADQSGHKMYRCKKCSYVCKKSGQMVGHINSHKNNLSIVKCPYCDFKSMPRTLKFHLRKCKGGLKSSYVKNTSKIEVDQNLVESFETHDVSSKEHLKCSSCLFSTTEEPKLKVHMKTHLLVPGILTDQSGDKMYRCKMCSYACERYMQLVGHTKTHKNSLSIVKCPNCDFKSTPRAVKFHLRTHKDRLKSSSLKKVCAVEINQGLNESTQDSEDLEDSTAAKLKLNVHKKEHPVDPEISILRSGYTMHECRMCSYTTHDLQRIRSHLNAHKINLPIAKCSTCDFKSTPRILNLHEKRHITVKSFSCKQCSFRTSSKFYHQQHIIRHERNLPVKKCPYCSFKSFVSVVKRHLYKCDGNKNISSEATKGRSAKVYKCKLCPFYTNKSQTYNNHMKIHPKTRHKNNKPVKIYKCELCPFYTNKSRDYSSHMRIHSKTRSDNTTADHVHSPQRKDDRVSLITGAYGTSQRKRKLSTKVYKCRLCSFVSMKGYSYFSHMNSHEQKQVIRKCPKCNFRSTPKYLSQHMYTKKHQKESKCRKCSFVCSNAYNLEQHMKSHLLMPIRKCPNCTFRSTVAVLRTHVKKCDSAACNKNDPPLNDKSGSGISEDGQLQTSKEIILDNDVQTKEDVSCKEASETVETDKISNTGTKKSEFRCSECPFLTHLRIKLNFHTKKYHSNFKKPDENADRSTNSKVFYKCGDCTYGTHDKYHYMRHVQTQHLYPKKNSIKKCRKCDYRSTKYDVKMHSQTCQAESKPKKVRCTFCSFSSFNMQNLKFHTEIKHCDELTFQDLFEVNKCNICDFVTLYKRKMNGHSKHKHAISDVLELNYSESHSDSNNDNNDQINTEAQYIESPKVNRGSEDKTVYKCTSCDFSSLYPGNLKRHLRMLHVDKSEFSSKQTTVGRMRQRSGNNNQFNDESTITLILRRRKEVNYVENEPEPEPSSRQSNIENAKQMCGEDNQFDEKRRMALNSKPQNDLHLVENQFDSSSSQSSIGSIEQKPGQDNQKSRMSSKSYQTEAILPDTDEEEIFMSSPGRYACSICSYTAAVKSRVYIHRETHGKNFPIKSCPNSNCSFKSTPKATSLHFLKCSKSRQPKSEFSNENTVSDVPKVFQCNICSYTSTLKSALKLHVNKSHVLEKLPVKKCVDCDFKGTQSVLERHRVICPYKTNLKELLNCSECSYSTYLPKKLRDHEDNTHTKKKDPEKEALKNTGPKSFRCEYCSFTSFWEYLIERHMNSHTLMKLPIKQCSRCDFRSTPAALTAHMNSCSKTSKNVLSGVPVNGSPLKKLKLLNGDVVDSLKIDSGKVINENWKKIEYKIGNEIAEAYNISRNDDVQRESQNKPLSNPASSHEVYLSNHKTEPTAVTVSEKEANAMETASDNSSENCFQCPKCVFSTKLRIKLKVHIGKNH